MNVGQEKAKLRKVLRSRLQRLDRLEQRSNAILSNLNSLPVYQSATTVMLYVSVRHEVRTMPEIEKRLAARLHTIVPYCEGPELELFDLHSVQELEPGAFAIPEPPNRLRLDPKRRVRADEIDVVIVPAIGFDRQGGRLGQGQGYYDRLLPRLRDDCCKIGIGYDVQLVSAIPIDTHDQRVDLVVCESSIYMSESYGHDSHGHNG